jgi:hypothetical protein
VRGIIAAALSVALAIGAGACADRNPSGPDGLTLSAPSGMVVSNPLAASSSASSISMRVQ